MINIDADVILVGGAAGSAKSYSLLMRLLRYKDDPNFRAIYFRRTTVQLTGAGGLWDEAKEMYSPFINRDPREKDYQIFFPSGCRAKFSHMELEKNAKDHQGLQYSAVFFDELTHFEESQFTYLMGRLRSKAEGNSFLMASMNPDPDSWVLKWIEDYIFPEGHEEAGLPNPELCGKIRYFVVDNGSPVFADSREILQKSHPHLCSTINKNTGEVIETPPKSFTFIGANIFDNPELIRANPNYLSELQSLPEPDRSRLFLGNWYARAKGSNYFQRNWLMKGKPPFGASSCRAYDKAATEPSEVNRNPDYTASIKISKDRNGFFYIQGSWHPDFKDDDSSIYGKFRKRPGARDALIESQARQDGTECKVVFAVDPGSSGKVEFQQSSSKLISKGFVVRQDPMPNTKGKLTRFEPFASACENGLVYIDEDSFPNKKTLEAFYKELEAFDGERSTANRKDDWPDCCASAFNFISRQTVLHKIPIQSGQAPLKQKLFNR